MSALVQLIHSPQAVVTAWEIGHDPDTKGDNDDARPGSGQMHSRTYRRIAQADRGCRAAGTHDAPGAQARRPGRTTRPDRADLQAPRSTQSRAPEDQDPGR